MWLVFFISHRYRIPLSLKKNHSKQFPLEQHMLHIQQYNTSVNYFSCNQNLAQSANQQRQHFKSNYKHKALLSSAAQDTRPLVYIRMTLSASCISQLCIGQFLNKAITQKGTDNWSVLDSQRSRLSFAVWKLSKERPTTQIRHETRSWNAALICFEHFFLSVFSFLPFRMEMSPEERSEKCAASLSPNHTTLCLFTVLKLLSAFLTASASELPVWELLERKELLVRALPTELKLIFKWGKKIDMQCFWLWFQSSFALSVLDFSQTQHPSSWISSDFNQI